jgi:DNA-binding response OmpR family regulator
MLPARVLIIDDSVVVRQVVKLLLAGHPHVGSLFEASSLDDAWRLLDSNDVDVITLDLNLPDGEGLNIIGPLRQKAGSDVIILSGNAEPHAEALRRGASACFEKAYLMPERSRFVDSILRAGEHSVRPH